jgi:hypothetical protein
MAACRDRWEGSNVGETGRGSTLKLGDWADHQEGEEAIGATEYRGEGRSLPVKGGCVDTDIGGEVHIDSGGKAIAGGLAGKGSGSVG